MVSVMDELREHTAALEAVAAAARDIQQEISPIRGKVSPAVEKLLELNAQIERRRHDVLGAAFGWALVGGVLGGFVGGGLLLVLIR